MPIRKRTSKRRALTREASRYGVCGGSAASWLRRGLPLEEAQERERAWISWKRSAGANLWLESGGVDGEPPPYLKEAID